MLKPASSWVLLGQASCACSPMHLALHGCQAAVPVDGRQWVRRWFFGTVWFGMGIARQKSSRPMPRRAQVSGARSRGTHRAVKSVAGRWFEPSHSNRPSQISRT